MIDKIVHFKNCEVIDSNDKMLFIKINNELLKYTMDIKSQIKCKNPELYCDCKKTKLINNVFEEVLEVEKEKTEGFDIGIYDLDLNFYGVYSKKSYKPLIKVTNLNTLNGTTFLKFPEDSDSDEEIENKLKKFNF
jgi:hypothetical protein